MEPLSGILPQHRDSPRLLARIRNSRASLRPTLRRALCHEGPVAHIPTPVSASATVETAVRTAENVANRNKGLRISARQRAELILNDSSIMPAPRSQSETARRAFLVCTRRAVLLLAGFLAISRLAFADEAPAFYRAINLNGPVPQLNSFSLLSSPQWRGDGDF